MRHSFIKSPSINGLECLAMRSEIVYDAVTAFIEEESSLSLKLEEFEPS